MAKSKVAGPSSREDTTASPDDLQAPPATFLLPLNTAFYLCLISHILSALYAPIQDCDETFNYWEPLHYLTHGYGLQTWEYSPEYSIRSWAYILLHTIPAKAVSFLGKSKTFEFYSIRVLLAAFCAGTETRLYSVISRTLNPRIGVFYLMIVAFSPGLFYASSAFLPSSFAMYTSTLGLTAFMDQRGGPKTVRAIMWFGTGAMLGWPFAGALIIPLALSDWISAVTNNSIAATYKRYFDGAAGCLAILALQIGIDSSFYRKLVVVPWRIVLYNVFSSGDRGPDIFGTEPWHFYIRNLLLNFNLWFFVALLSGPLLTLHHLFSRQQISQQATYKLATLTLPFYLWFGIFTLQPHKEERFMYPAYPFLSLSAAIGLHVLLSWLGSLSHSSILGQIPAKIRLAIVLATVLATINIGLLRILGTTTAYRAPLQIYEAFSTQQDVGTTSSTTLCLGKEWYRLPSSHFLPGSSHAKFVKSDFNGLLPGEFLESRPSSSRDAFSSLRFPGTYTLPSGMNDRNEEDPGKYTPLSQCDYLVDSTSTSFKPTANEPDYIRSAEWEVVVCRPFLDVGVTHVLARTIWVPDLPIVPARFRRKWGEYCLLKRS